MGAVPFDVVGGELGGVGGSDVGAVAVEHVDPLPARVLSILGDEVGGVGVPTAG
ncbi:hypothetical protein [Branchiibius cervicis]|uniref:Uncharacterized protein n=1 Tax=Branchiibius cervicis TaxID=908252 RepID=A0ABW2ANU7_9MICO